MERYQKRHKLGEGAYGSVYLAIDKKTGEQVALKKVKLQKMSKAEREKAHYEVELLSSLKHPNIVAYKDSWTVDNYLFIAMEYVDGGDLNDKILRQNDKPFTLQAILDIFVQITLALQYIHGKNVLHRDLKPQNIFLTKNNVVKLGDFGVAKVMENSFDFAHTLIGTPYYLAPEVWSGEAYNAKADMYSLGVMLYEMCCLRKPYLGNNTAQLYSALLKGEYPPVPSTYPVELCRLVDGMLSPKPMERPSASQILKIPFIKNAMDSLATKREEIITTKQKRLLPANIVALSKSKKIEFEDDFIDASELSPSKPSHADFDGEFEDDFIDEADHDEIAEAANAIRQVLESPEECDTWQFMQSARPNDDFANESLTCCIEELREKLEKELGFELFRKVYNEINDGNEGSAVDECRDFDGDALMLVRRLIELEQEVVKNQ